MSDHVRRIEQVEGKVKLLKEDGAAKDDLKKLRAETKKVYVSRRSSSLSYCRGRGRARANPRRLSLPASSSPSINLLVCRTLCGSRSWSEYLQLSNIRVFVLIIPPCLAFRSRFPQREDAHRRSGARHRTRHQKEHLPNRLDLNNHHELALVVLQSFRRA